MLRDAGQLRDLRRNFDLNAMDALVDRRPHGLKDERFAIACALYSVSLEHHLVDCDVVELQLHLCKNDQELVTHVLGCARARRSVLRRRIRAAPCLGHLGLKICGVRRQGMSAASSGQNDHGSC